MSSLSWRSPSLCSSWLTPTAKEQWQSSHSTWPRSRHSTRSESRRSSADSPPAWSLERRASDSWCIRTLSACKRERRRRGAACFSRPFHSSLWPGAYGLLRLLRARPVPQMTCDHRFGRLSFRQVTSWIGEIWIALIFPDHKAEDAWRLRQGAEDRGEGSLLIARRGREITALSPRFHPRRGGARVSQFGEDHRLPDGARDTLHAADGLRGAHAQFCIGRLRISRQRKVGVDADGIEL